MDPRKSVGSLNNKTGGSESGEGGAEDGNLKKRRNRNDRGSIGSSQEMLDES